MRLAQCWSDGFSGSKNYGGGRRYSSHLGEDRTRHPNDVRFQTVPPHHSILHDNSDGPRVPANANGATRTSGTSMGVAIPNKPNKARMRPKRRGNSVREA